MNVRRILLIEPGFRNKYPPLGLMKISSYHKRRGDLVEFAKGQVPEKKMRRWDRIYVSSLFTYHWATTIREINYYSGSVSNPKDVWVGGVMATLLGDEIEELTGATVIRGLLDKPGILDPDAGNVDALVPDYSLLADGGTSYGLDDAYVAYSTRGCPNKCRFCAVRQIEPTFVDYLPLKVQLKTLEMLHGKRRNLVLLDNNVFASKEFPRIINDLCELGFEAGAKLDGRLRHVDFNQGTDARLVTPENMRLLSRVAIRPLRLAFDDSRFTKQYETAVRLAADCGIRNLSNYVLFNFEDTPEDFYGRLRRNPELNAELGTQIYSFPMKFIPLDAKDRSFVGQNWTPRMLRGVQCVLVATRGMVGTKLDFFEAAFGHDANEFRAIVNLPERYIIDRAKRRDEIEDLLTRISELSPTEHGELMEYLREKRVAPDALSRASTASIKTVLEHYVHESARNE